MRRFSITFGLLLFLPLISLCLTGCGGGGGSNQFSTVTGAVSDVNRSTLVGADVWVDNGPKTQSLLTGTYKLDGVQSGWQTIHASETINGVKWVGSTAAEVLGNQPTMNIHIVLAPEGKTTTIQGTVRDDTGARVSYARVLLTMQSSSSDGAYGSIVALADKSGQYVMNNVPVVSGATISASKVGYHNSELTSVNTGTLANPLDFALVGANLPYKIQPPTLNYIESWTMPDTITRSGSSPYKAIKAYIESRRQRSQSLKVAKSTKRDTPSGSLIEIDVAWSASANNPSRNIAGYNIYRSTSLNDQASAIDFIRDPYANYYEDTGVEITPGQNYYYWATTLDVGYLDQNGNFDANSESTLSGYLYTKPLDQLQAISPGNGAYIGHNPTFTWSPLYGATAYSVYVFDQFPAYNGSEASSSISPIWSYGDNTGETIPVGSPMSLAYNGPSLVSGQTYYWVVVARNVYETYSDGSSKRAAYSYGQLRSFTR